MFDPAVTFDDLAWLRSEWDGPLVVKGIVSQGDAEAGGGGRAPGGGGGGGQDRGDAAGGGLLDVVLHWCLQVVAPRMTAQRTFMFERSPQ
jgi:hypothetical protein